MPAVLSSRSLNVATPPTTVAVIVPVRVPAPVLKDAVTTVLLSVVTRLSYWSSSSSTIGSVSGLPAVTFGYGCVWITNWAAWPGLIVMVSDGPADNWPSAKLSEMVPLTSSARPVKVATPPDTVAVVEPPTSGPLPEASEAVMTVLIIALFEIAVTHQAHQSRAESETPGRRSPRSKVASRSPAGRAPPG